MSAADGSNVVSIVDKLGRPVMRTWRVVVQTYGPPPMLGTALVRAATGRDACAIAKHAYSPCVVFDFEDASNG